MIRILSSKYLIFLSRLLLGFTFVIASLEKIVLPEVFAVSIIGYKLLPYGAVNIIALILPWMELICGIFLIAGFKLKGSSILLCSILFIFIFAIVSALIRKLEIDCGCFGGLSSAPVSWQRVLEDIGLLLLGVHIYLFSEKSASDRITPAPTAAG